MHHLYYFGDRSRGTDAAAAEIIDYTFFDQCDQHSA